MHGHPNANTWLPNFSTESDMTGKAWTHLFYEDSSPSLWYGKNAWTKIKKNKIQNIHWKTLNWRFKHDEIKATDHNNVKSNKRTCKYYSFTLKVKAVQILHEIKQYDGFVASDEWFQGFAVLKWGQLW